MIRIVSPDEYRSTPWKNGKGHTLELAISAGHTVESFDWRISIAQVVEDGPFSDFSGYDRSLFLLEGSGIGLEHDRVLKQSLVNLLDVAHFEGGSATVARLRAGPITDFNLMTRQGRYQVQTETRREAGYVDLADALYTFVFCQRRESLLRCRQGRIIAVLPAGHLMALEQDPVEGNRIEGAGMIVIQLLKLSG